MVVFTGKVYNTENSKMCAFLLVIYLPNYFLIDLFQQNATGAVTYMCYNTFPFIKLKIKFLDECEIKVCENINLYGCENINLN